MAAGIGDVNPLLQRQVESSPSLARPPARRIRDLVPHDGMEPWHERALGIPLPPLRVKTNQDLLNNVFDLVRMHAEPRQSRADNYSEHAGYFPEKLLIDCHVSGALR